MKISALIDNSIA